MEEISLTEGELHSDIKKLIYSRIDFFLTQEYQNPKEILVFELFSGEYLKTTTEKQLISKDLNYFPWFCYIFKNTLHYASLKCTPLPVLPTIKISILNNIKDTLENFEQVELKYNSKKELELNQEYILSIVSDTLMDYRFQNNKQYKYWIDSNKAFIDLSNL